MKPAFDAAHIGSAQGAQIENRAGAFRDHIGTGTAVDDVGIDADTAARVVPRAGAFGRRDVGVHEQRAPALAVQVGDERRRS